MKNEATKRPDYSTGDDSIAIADAVARAAHIWIRSVCLNETQEPAERHALASGLVAGLCEHLDLNPGIRELIAYVYTLLDNEGSQSLSISRTMLDRPVALRKHHAFERGRSEASGILEMLAYHNRRTADSKFSTRMSK